MLVKMNGEHFGVILNNDFKTLVGSLDKSGLDTRVEIETFFKHLDHDQQIQMSHIVVNQMHDLYGNLNHFDLNTLWDLFLGLF